MAPASFFAHTTKTSATGALLIPGLRPREHVTTVGLARPGLHRARVRAGVGLGEPEAADDLAAREPGEVLLALRLVAVGADGVHDEARLDADGGAIAGIDPLDFPGDQAVAHVSGAGAAVPVDGGPEQSALPHLAHDRPVEALGAVRFEDAGHQRALRIVARRVADHALLLGEGDFEQ